MRAGKVLRQQRQRDRGEARPDQGNDLRREEAAESGVSKDGDHEVSRAVSVVDCVAFVIPRPRGSRRCTSR